jgi:hypothetical protein
LLGGCFYFYFQRFCGKITRLPRDEIFTEVLEV